ncbi:MAG: glycosyltransferase [Saprospiraceae bacterium]|nr:glycosyltransferase [Saprospiraceae bacterium]
MKKILFVFHPIQDVRDSFISQKHRASHHYWFYDQLRNTGHQVDVLKTNAQSTLLNKLGNRLGINFLQQQIDCVLRAKHYDLIFFPFMEFSFLIAFLRSIKLFNKPLISVAQYAYKPDYKHSLKNLKSQGIRYVYFKGTDLILFYNEQLFKRSQCASLKGKSIFIDNWGVDVDHFQTFIDAQVNPPRKDYFYCTGGSLRDFKTLVSAFNSIEYPLKITTVGNLKGFEDCTLTPNITLDNSLPFGSTSVIRQDYYDALAVMVPLSESERLDTSGITVVMEAMAMGKPVITTQNKAYPFDVEKEKVGLNVAYSDVEGWRQAARYIFDHPDLVEEMSARARYLVQKKYNYKLFTEQVNQQVCNFIRKEKQSAPTQRIQLQKRSISSKELANL